MAGALAMMIRWFKPLRRQDPVFGSMLFMKGMGYWETNPYFEPLQMAIEVFVDGGEEDDLDLQHQFFREVSAN